MEAGPFSTALRRSNSNPSADPSLDCSHHSAPGSESTVTPPPSRNEECHFPGPSVLRLTHPHLHSFSASFHTASFVCVSGARGGSQGFLQPSSLYHPEGRWTVLTLICHWMPTGRWLGVRRVMIPRGPSQQAGESGHQIGTHRCSFKVSTTVRLWMLSPPVIPRCLGIFSEWLEG